MMRPVAPEGGVDEILRESLRLRLSANENRDAKNNSAQAENEGAFAMEKKAQGDMKRRRHSGFSCAHDSCTVRCLTNCPGLNLSWSETTTRSPSFNPSSTSENSRVR